MNRTRSSLFLILALLLSSSTSRGDEAAQIEFFEQKIRPVLVEKCYACHSGSLEEVEGKLWLDSKSGWTRGGQSGPAIVPGKPESSLLLHAIKRTEKDLAMPPEEKLPAAVIADFETWIRRGAIDPRVTDGAVRQSPVLSERERWVFSKPVKPTLPDVRNETWVRQPIDRFILSRLEPAPLAPTAEAPPEQLVRRLHFDLNGLPPTPEEIDAFVQAAKTDRQQAVVSLVDELLARPAYGEKWGRYWLDCVRYADSLDARSTGKGDITDAWRYRDWVVSAFRSDLPYNDFVRQQIAGDLLAQEQWNPDLVIATGVYAIGNWGNGDSDKRKVHTDIVDDQIDVTSRAFLGLTLSCARCHDHKFDPLTTADYYAMAGFFFSSRILEKFADPTAGESLMRIDLLSPQEQSRRNDLLARLAEIDRQLKQGLIPLTRRVENVAGRPELVSWTPAQGDHPSLTINSGHLPQAYSTINLPARAVCVHPSPKEAVTIAWKSPVAGEIKVTALIEDIDGNCGDGVSWSLEQADRNLAKGVIANAGPIGQTAATSLIHAGQLVRLIVSPRQNYYCDSTRVDLTIEHPESGQTWNLTQSLLNSTSIPKAGEPGFLICSGDAADMAGETSERPVLLARQQELKSQLPTEVQCQGLQEGGIPGSPYEGFHDVSIHVRGNYNRLASVQPRGFPSVFQTPAPQLEGSGRFALADWISSNDNPLTARVLVNRLWQHHFGRGIVATANNFGKLGTPPSHPELLDWLAVTFMERGWSIQEMHRLICTSATYQQSSVASPETLERDPDNVLYSRQTRRKLTAEELRDAMLSVTGDLDRTSGGPAVADIHSPRRTLYLKTVRSDRTSYQLLFDGADPTSIVEQRNDSLVAPQALWLLNQPFVIKRAARLADRVMETPALSPDERLALLVKQLFARSPRADDLSVLSRFLDDHAESETAWRIVCHVLLCSNEFLFVD